MNISAVIYRASHQPGLVLVVGDDDGVLAEVLTRLGMSPTGYVALADRQQGVYREVFDKPRQDIVQIVVLVGKLTRGHIVPYLYENTELLVRDLNQCRLCHSQSKS